MWSARRSLVAGMGALAGLTGVEHGVGAVMQGSRATGGLVFPSWPGSAFFAVLDGEPAMSLVPNYLLTGVLAIVASLTFVAVAVAFADRRHAGLALIGLSVVMLLLGAGFGPPLLGVMVGLAATKVRSPLGWWRRHSNAAGRLAALWPWVLAACLAAWLTLSPGVPAAALLVEVDSLAVIPAVFLAAMSLLAASIFASQGYDSLVQHES